LPSSAPRTTPRENSVTPEAVEEILEGMEGLLFLDNAYVEFFGHRLSPLMRRHENLILGRTMSKIFALAGMRVGLRLRPGVAGTLLPPGGDTVCLKLGLPRGSGRGSRRHRPGARDVRSCPAVEKPVPRRVPFRTFPRMQTSVMIDVSPLTGDEAVTLAAKGRLVRSLTSFPGSATTTSGSASVRTWENERFLEAAKNL